MQLFSRRHRQQRMLLVATLAAAGVAVAILVWPDSDNEPTSAVPTVPVADTPVDIECVDTPGTVTAKASEWYRDDAAGVVAFRSEISSSTPQLSVLADKLLDGAADIFGGYATSRIRDMSPTMDYCVTLHYVQVTLDDGSDLVARVWRSVAAAAPRSLPNEGEFVAQGDHLFVSSGQHLVSVLAVAPDGTSVLISAYGTGALDAFTLQPQLVDVTINAADLGNAPATADQLIPLAEQVLQAMTTRPAAG